MPEALQKESDDQYHYQWAGWTLVEGTALGEDGSCRGDAVYRAYFTSALRSHTVAFYDYDGQLLTQGDYAYDAEVSPEDPSRESDLRYTYAFSHWQAYADAALETPLEGVTLPAGGTLTVRKAAYFKAVKESESLREQLAAAKQSADFSEMLKKPENAVIAAQNEAVEKCVIENYLKKISKGRAVEVVGGNIGATPVSEKVVPKTLKEAKIMA